MSVPSGHRIAVCLATLQLFMTVALAPAQAQTTAGPSVWEVTDRQGVFIEGELISLSPDGRWIAGIDMDNTFCVWEVATEAAQCDGTDLGIDVDSVRWSPDSTAVAFAQGPFSSGQDTDIFIFERKTGVLTNLTDEGYEGTSFVQPGEIDTLPVDLYPTWSADSHSLTFIRCDIATNDRLFTTELVSMSRMGSEAIQIFAIHDPYPFTMASPIFSLRDGSLLFTITMYDESDPANGIWHLNPHGETQQLLASTSDDLVNVKIVRVVEAGTSTLVSAFGLSPELDESVALLLNVGTGTVTPVDDPVVGFSPDGESMLAWTENENGTEMLTITDASGGVTEVNAGRDLSRGGWRGYDWAANNTILIPIGKNFYNDGGGLLVTVQRAPGATLDSP
jgi:WD40 repeat protein